MNRDDLRAQIKKWCKDNGATQRVLADRLGVTPETVCRWVTGKTSPNEDMMLRLLRIVQTRA